MGQLKLTMFGLDADFLVTTPGEYELTRHMKEPVPVDLGDYVMSPMPGTLVSFAVKVRPTYGRDDIDPGEAY